MASRTCYHLLYLLHWNSHFPQHVLKTSREIHVVKAVSKEQPPLKVTEENKPIISSALHIKVAKCFKFCIYQIFFLISYPIELRPCFTMLCAQTHQMPPCPRVANAETNDIKVCLQLTNLQENLELVPLVSMQVQRCCYFLEEKNQHGYFYFIEQVFYKLFLLCRSGIAIYLTQTHIHCHTPSSVNGLGFYAHGTFFSKGDVSLVL